MTIKFYYHPLASYCHKVLIALYENDVEFTPVFVDLGDAESREAFRTVWPLLKFPVLVDDVRGNTVGESASIIEYLDTFISPDRPLEPFRFKWKQFDGRDFSGLQGEYRKPDVNIGRGFRRSRRGKDHQAELSQDMEVKYETAIVRN